MQQKNCYNETLLDIRELIYLKEHLRKEDFRAMNIFENIFSSIIDIIFYLFIPYSIAKDCNLLLINKVFTNADIFDSFLNEIFFDNITYYQFLICNIPLLGITNITLLIFLFISIIYILIMYKTSSSLGMLLFNVRIYDIKTFKPLSLLNVIKRFVLLIFSVCSLKILVDIYNGNVMLYNLKTHTLPLVKLKNSLI